MEKKRLRVLYLITKANFGGAQRYVYDLATHLDPTHYEVVVVAGGDGILLDALKHRHIRTIALPELRNTIAPKAVLDSMKALMTLIRTERPDIIHSNSSVAGLLGSIIGRIMHVPTIIFTAHGWAFNEARPWYEKALFVCLHGLTVLLSHTTIAVSQALITQLPLPGKYRKTKIIHPGRTIGPMYEKVAAREHLASLHPALTVHQNDYWLGHVAELHPIKNQSLLLRMMETLIHEHPTLRLIIIGEGSEQRRLESEIVARGLGNHVFMLGSIFEAARFLKAFDMFVLSSDSESYGYVLHEAGLATLPVVATAVGGIPEIITNGTSGFLVPPGDTAGFTHAVNGLINDPARAEAFGTTLSMQMQERSVERMVISIDTLYRHHTTRPK